REQDVKHVEDVVQAARLVGLELLLRLYLRVRERRECVAQPRLVRCALPAAHGHEDEEVLRLREEAVEGSASDGELCERRAAGRRLEDSSHAEDWPRSLRCE